MAHLPSQKLLDSNPFSQSKTLFMIADSVSAILVTRSGNKMRRRTLKFGDCHAALDWCLKSNAGFMLTPCSPVDASLN